MAELPRVKVWDSTVKDHFLQCVNRTNVLYSAIFLIFTRATQRQRYCTTALCIPYLSRYLAINTIWILYSERTEDVACRASSVQVEVNFKTTNLTVFATKKQMLLNTGWIVFLALSLVYVQPGRHTNGASLVIIRIVLIWKLNVIQNSNTTIVLVLLICWLSFITRLC